MTALLLRPIGGSAVKGLAGSPRYGPICTMREGKCVDADLSGDESGYSPMTARSLAERAIAAASAVKPPVAAHQHDVTAMNQEIRSTPPINGCNALGMLIEPSAF